MQAVEVRGLGVLAGLALAGGVQRIGQAHAGIAERVFDSVARGVGPAVAPVRVVHDRVSSTAYGVVQSTLSVGARLAGAAASRRAGDDGPSLGDRPRARVALGVLNGAHGDVLAERARALALPMSVRAFGRDVPPEPTALAEAYPDASGRVVVFLHGLVETEDAWRYHAARHHGDHRTTYGSLLERDFGVTAVYVRYNSGLRVSVNGAQLDELLDQLVDAWPVPVDDLVLIGHSMGGLVARSGLAQAGEGTAAGQRRWPGLVRDTITLGTPHLGAPLEQGVHQLSRQLRRLPETRWLADQLDARSVGIKDLRHGDLLETHWNVPDADAPGSRRTRVPLHGTARHFVVLATFAGSHDSLAGRLLGDLLVTPHSAVGDTGDVERLAFADDAVLRLRGLHHLDLLNHPDVYAAISRWLTDQPVAGAAAPGTSSSTDSGVLVRQSGCR